MTYEINENAYTFELIENSSGFFDNSIGATYVIHLEGNGRLDSIKNQLKEYIPSKKIYILHNKGFKTGLKPDYITATSQDLDDAYVTCFKHSQNKHFKNILILEDDFIFDKNINNTEITDDINQFILKKTDEKEIFIYYLGCIPITIQEYSNKHFKCLSGWVTHSIIYSEQFVKFVLEDSQLQEDIFNNYIGWDNFIEKYSQKNTYFKRYLYKDCLCYQPFTETENSKIWYTKLFNNKFINTIIQENINIILKNSDTLNINLLLLFDLLYQICIKLPKNDIFTEIFNNLTKYNILYK
jgi:hypothetical protein